MMPDSTKMILKSARKERPKSCVVGIVQSKFRHVETLLGSKIKSAFINLRNVNNRLPADSNGFCVSKKYAAVSFSGCAGLVAIFELTHPVKLPDGIIDGLQNRVQLMDMHWNPFRVDELAVGLENGYVNIWRIPENINCIGHSEEPPVLEKTSKTLTKIEDEISVDKKLADLQPFKILKVGVGAKVTQVRYHPTTNNILAISLLNGSIQIWSLNGNNGLEEEEPKCLLELNTKTQFGILSMAWSSDGYRLAIVSRDGFLRVFEPLSKISENKCVGEKKVLDITRAARVLFVCDDSLILLVYFNKSSNRQCQLYRTDDLELIHTELIDTSTQLLVPHYDYDTSVLFLSGKGDRSIQMFEISTHQPYFLKLSPFNGVAGHQAIAFHQKDVCDVMQVEFQRGWRLSEKVLESISFRVPRVKKDLFQRDLFPNALVTWEPVNILKDWLDGSLNPPKFVDLCPPNTEETLNVARMVTQKLALRSKLFDFNTTTNGTSDLSSIKIMKTDDSELKINENIFTTNSNKSIDLVIETQNSINPETTIKKLCPEEEDRYSTKKEENGISLENISSLDSLKKNGIATTEHVENGGKGTFSPILSQLNNTPEDIQHHLKQGLSNVIEKVEASELQQDRMEGVLDSEWTEPSID